MVSASSLRSTSSLILGGYREKQFHSCPNFVINFARNFHQFRILGQVYPTYTVILLWDQNLQAPPSTKYVVAVVQSLSHIELSVTPWATARQVSLSFTNSLSLPKLMSSDKSVMPSNHLILYCPLLLLPSVFPSIRVFSNELVLCIRRPTYWSFSISPSKEYSGLISFWIDWFDLSRIFSSTAVPKH